MVLCHVMSQWLYLSVLLVHTVLTRAPKWTGCSLLCSYVTKAFWPEWAYTGSHCMILLQLQLIMSRQWCSSYLQYSYTNFLKFCEFIHEYCALPGLYILLMKESFLVENSCKVFREYPFKNNAIHWQIYFSNLAKHFIGQAQYITPTKYMIETFTSVHPKPGPQT